MGARRLRIVSWFLTLDGKMGKRFIWGEIWRIVRLIRNIPRRKLLVYWNKGFKVILSNGIGYFLTGIFQIGKDTI